MVRTDVAPDEANLILAEILFAKNSYPEAIQQFWQILEKTPNNYRAFSKLVEMMRRSGTLSDAEAFFASAEKRNLKAKQEAGYHYCRGLYYRYTNKPNQALVSFKNSRRDVEWGDKATCHMIELFLNPDNDTVGGEVLEGVSEGNKLPGEREVEMAAVVAAEKLLKELPVSTPALRREVLECHVMMATKQKLEIEGACQRFLKLLEREKEYVPALLVCVYFIRRVRANVIV